MAFNVSMVNVVFTQGDLLVANILYLMLVLEGGEGVVVLQR